MDFENTPHEEEGSTLADMQADMQTSAPASTAVRYVTVGAHEAGQRLDNYLLTELKGVPKSRIYRMVRTGEVRVNKGRVKPLQRLSAGDVVRIPPLRISEHEAVDLPPGRVAAMRDLVLYEDHALLILNKPPGLAVHGGSGVPYGLIELARASWGHLPGLELAHRLDRDTSGVLVLAKSREALLGVQKQLVEGTARKAYLALMRGDAFRKIRGVMPSIRVEAPLHRFELQGGERVVKVDFDEGKEAISQFTRLESFPPLASLARVSIETGRTHQIRVHAQHLGAPLAGDEKYGDDAFNKRMKAFGLKRIFLHAEQLELMHPLDEVTLRIEAPMPADLQAVLQSLRAGGGR